MITRIMKTGSWAAAIALGILTPWLLMDSDQYQAYGITPAGVIIQNQATATYVDSSGSSRNTSSNLVQTLVQEVVGIDLVQGQTKTVSQGTTVNYVHFLTNTGNAPEAYTVCLDQSAFGGAGANINVFTFQNLQVMLDSDLDGLGDTALASATEPVHSVTSADLTPTPAGNPDAGCFSIPTLAGGDSVQLVVSVDIPTQNNSGGVLNIGDEASFLISAYAETEPEANFDIDDVDVAQITNEPTLEVLKAISENSGVSPSGPYTVTLTYRNTGTLDARNLQIIEQLPTSPEAPSTNTGGMTFITNTSSWVHRDNGNTQIDSIAVLTDVDEVVQQGTGFGTTGINVTYCAYDVSCTNSPFASDQMVIQVSSIPAGESGTISFDINIDSGLDESDVLINAVTFVYENTSGVELNNNGNPFDSNAVTFTIQNLVSMPAVVANDTGATGGELLGVDDSLAANNIVYEQNSFDGIDPLTSTIQQGGSGLFYNYIWNTGDGNDTFDINIDSVNDRLGNPIPVPFPAGTIFTLFQSDGITPLLDTNSNGIPDTGPIAPGSVYLVAVGIQPPADVFGDNSGFGWDATLRATSGADANISNAVTDHLSVIVQSFVDLTNDLSFNTNCVDAAGMLIALPDPNCVEGAPDADPLGYEGEGIGPEATGVNTINLTIGGTTYFPLVVNNRDLGNGGASDSFNLEFSTSNFVAGQVPSGWTISFFSSLNGTDCSVVSSAITNTGSLAPATQFLVCVGITLDTGLVADGQLVDIFFRSQSPTTGTEDIKLDSFLVTAGPAIGITPDHTGQGSPGAFITYPHEIQNSGNTALECLNVAAVNDLAADGWTVQVLLDVNGDGAEDAGDVPFTQQFDSNSPLLPGQAINALVKIFVPGTAAPSTANTTVVTVTANRDDLDTGANTCTGIQVSDFSTDRTTANNADGQIVKAQALDADCDGAEDAADVFVTTSFQVNPNQCVRYRLTTTNTGIERMLNLTVNDLTPTFTTYLQAAEECVVDDGTGTLCDPTPWSVNATAPGDGGTGVIAVDVPALEPGGTVTLYFGIRVE